MQDGFSNSAAQYVLQLGFWRSVIPRKLQEVLRNRVGLKWMQTSGTHIGFWIIKV